MTRGSYQYVDANNVVQTVHYTADDINGFRVAATNVPVATAGPIPVVETPEVAAARADHLAAHEAAKTEVAAAEVAAAEES